MGYVDFDTRQSALGAGPNLRRSGSAFGKRRESHLWIIPGVGIWTRNDRRCRKTKKGFDLGTDGSLAHWLLWKLDEREQSFVRIVFSSSRFF